MKENYIAFLRGINVGGHKKIIMKDLKILFEKQGFQKVQTYIQSGNVVFSSSYKKESIALVISDAILTEYGWEVPVLVKTVSEIEAILDDCPFSIEKKEKSYFTLLGQPPLQKNRDMLQMVSFSNEEFLITPLCVYFYCSLGYRNVKMNGNFLERKLKVVTTTRNYNTMVKIVHLAKNS